MNPDLQLLFTEKHLRATKPRLAVFSALERSSAPISAAELMKKCPTVDKVTIYRTIDIFLKLGIAKSVPYGWKQRYELAEPFNPHHHHIHCTNCSRVVEIHSAKLEQMMAAIAAHHDFSITSHAFEIEGLCHSCRATRPAA
jgi:Fe2+ or Zn2+ uptake regulation protein